MKSFEQAVAKQDSLPLYRATFLVLPDAAILGAALLAGGDAQQAEAVFRRDLELYLTTGGPCLV